MSKKFNNMYPEACKVDRFRASVQQDVTRKKKKSAASGNAEKADENKAK